MDIRPIDANALHALYAGPFIQTYAECRKALDDAPTLSLNTLRDAIYQDAVAHGLWEGTYNLETAVTSIGEEAIELVEAAIYAEENRDEDGGLINENWMHFVEELADVVISGFSVAGKLGIDIDAAIRNKMAVNKTRPWKHGKANDAES